MYTVATKAYEGPLQKLLELIQKKELEINRVSLTEVTAGFLDYVGKLERESPDPEHAEFLSVASKLILLKSLSLLPQLALTKEEEEDLQTLEHQLQALAYVDACKKDVERAWKNEPPLVSREFMMNMPRRFIPPAAVTPLVLAQKATEFAPPPPSTPAYAKRRYVSIETTMARILSQLNEDPGQLAALQKSGSREERVAFFLAVLHLMRRLKIAVSQNGIFGEITIYSKQPYA